MKFLEINETSRLQLILSRHPLLAEDARAETLSNCDLSDVCDYISLSGGGSTFTNRLCAHILTHSVLSRATKKTGLVALLEYICIPPHDGSLSGEDKQFLQHVMVRYEVWWNEGQYSTHTIPRKNASGTQSMIRQLLVQERQKQHEPVTPQKRIRIDRGIITRYDLTDSMALFKHELQLNRMCAFSISGNSYILQNYMIERMYAELRSVFGCEPQRHTVNLHKPHLREDLSSVIQNQLYAKYECDTLINIYGNEDSPVKQIVLVVWNYEFPAEKLKIAASSFWSEATRGLSLDIQKKDYRFVCILANADSHRNSSYIDKFVSLPKPKRFDLEHLCAWFEGMLNGQEVEPNDIAYCIDMLRNHHGHFDATYQEMENVVNYLQRRYSAS